MAMGCSRLRYRRTPPGFIGGVDRMVSRAFARGRHPRLSLPGERYRIPARSPQTNPLVGAHRRLFLLERFCDKAYREDAEKVEGERKQDKRGEFYF